MGQQQELVADFLQFLTRSTRPDVRRISLTYLVSNASAAEEENIVHAENFAILKQLLTLYNQSDVEDDLVLTVFVNSTSVSYDCAAIIAENNGAVKKSVLECQKEAAHCLRAAQLLSNLSRHHPGRLLVYLDEHWPKAYEHIVDLQLSTRDEQFVEYMGYVLVNLSTVRKARKSILPLVPKLIPLLGMEVQSDRRMTAVSIFRNLSFDDDVHENLLDGDDEFLTALLAPLADERDELDEEETGLLPIGLQYYDKNRDDNEQIREKIVETLYQLCATKFGRETLRSKGVYPVLREMDKALKPNRPELTLTDHSDTLQALIGVLIRKESEMAVPDDLQTIRNLQ
jgi:hypothetical protein